MPQVSQFRRLWAELHLRAAGAHAPDRSSELAWLRHFANRIPCNGCRRHWLEIAAKLPPDFSSRSAHFAWTVRAHNAINHRLGKPIMTLHAARTRWRFDSAR